MSCPGLHCPGCSGGQSLGILGGVVVGLAVADQVVPWVAERIAWIGGTAAVCFALAVAASMWLERFNDVRGARWGAEHGIYSRADAILLAPVRPVIIQPAPEPTALAGPQITVNIFGTPSAEQAAIIRRVLPKRAGETSIGEK
jgi:Na+(H+)/acetate symporter ActP